AGQEVFVGGNALAGGFQVPLIAAADSAPADAWIVAEVSSFQLEWTEQFRPRVAVITNITADHLNRHGTLEVYAAAKARILDAQAGDDWAILNADNAATAALAPRARGRLALFSRDSAPAAAARGWTEARGGERWLLIDEGCGEEPVCRAAD